MEFLLVEMVWILVSEFDVAVSVAFIADLLLRDVDVEAKDWSWLSL